MCLCIGRNAGRFAHRLENDEEPGNPLGRNSAIFSAKACKNITCNNITAASIKLLSFRKWVGNDFYQVPIVWDDASIWLPSLSQPETALLLPSGNDFYDSSSRPGSVNGSGDFSGFEVDCEHGTLKPWGPFLESSKIFSSPKSDF